MGQILARHPSVAYLEEPSLVWRYGNAHLNTDTLDEERAEQRTVDFIRKYFEDFLRDSGKSQLVEKTPANSLRPMFVNKIFPEARFVHIVRDGRRVVESMMGQWLNDYDPSKVRIPGQDVRFRHLRKQIGKLRQIPLAETRHYVAPILAELLHKSGLKGRKTWGPSFPEQEKLSMTASKEEVCALQWKLCVETVMQSRDGIGQDRILEIKYEELVEQPSRVIGQVLDFIDLDSNDVGDMTHFVGTSPDLSYKSEMDPEIESKVMRIIDPIMMELGYQ